MVSACADLTTSSEFARDRPLRTRSRWAPSPRWADHPAGQAQRRAANKLSRAFPGPFKPPADVRQHTYRYICALVLRLTCTAGALKVPSQHQRFGQRSGRGHEQWPPGRRPKCCGLDGALRRTDFLCDKEYQTLWMDLEFQRRVQLQCLTVW